MQNCPKMVSELNRFEPTYKPYGNQAILIEWPSKIDKNILNDILLFKEKIVYYNSKVIVDIINTYNSITIIYDSTIRNIYNEILRLKSIYLEEFSGEKENIYRWQIPVCYDLKFGIDLEEISIQKKLSIEEIIKLHSERIYTVYFIGFLPGFLYLGGLDERLHIPRKATPRFKVEKGSVAIGGSQTGVYPVESAGGWQIMGKSPVSFFDISLETPCFAKPGDEIVFTPVDMEEYLSIEEQVVEKSYKLNKSIVND